MSEPVCGEFDESQDGVAQLRTEHDRLMVEARERASPGKETTARPEDAIGPVTARVLEIRQARECGMTEAKTVATREAMLDAIDAADTMDDLKRVLRTLVGGFR